MVHDKDKILLRGKDLALLALAGTVIGMLAGPMRKYFQLEATICKVERLEEHDNIRSTDIAVIKEQNQQIMEQLKQVNWQLRSINRSGRRFPDGE